MKKKQGRKDIEKSKEHFTRFTEHDTKKKKHHGTKVDWMQNHQFTENFTQVFSKEGCKTQKRNTKL